MARQSLQESWDTVVLAWLVFRYRRDIREDPELKKLGFNSYAHSLYFEWILRHDQAWTTDRYKKVTRILKMNSLKTGAPNFGKNCFKSEVNRGDQHKGEEDEEAQIDAIREEDDNGEKLHQRLMFYWKIIEYLELRFHYHRQPNMDFKQNFVQYVAANWPITLIIPVVPNVRTHREMIRLAKMMIDERADSGNSRATNRKNTPRTCARIPPNYPLNYGSATPAADENRRPWVFFRRLLQPFKSKAQNGLIVNSHKLMSGPTERSGQTPSVI